MNAFIRPAIALVLMLTLVTGVAAPLIVTNVAQALLPYQANGSMIERQGQVIGSALIGQNFTSDRYFHSRPSATSEADPENEGKTRSAPYNASASAASQLGPLSEGLLATVRERVDANGPAPVPADLAYASGSGLDPHISPATALRQVAGIAAARKLGEGRVRNLVLEHSQGREFGLLGEPRVNVLQLNLALDELR